MMYVARDPTLYIVMQSLDNPHQKKSTPLQNPLDLIDQRKIPPAKKTSSETLTQEETPLIKFDESWFKNIFKCLETR